MINFNTTAEEDALIDKIRTRIKETYGADCDNLEREMDLVACHSNGCPLDLKKLLEFPDFDFSHDVFGISKHLNRTTGKLENCFLPRCHK